MKRASLLVSLSIGISTLSAFGAAFTPGNITVLQCAGVSSGGNAGALLEYTPGGTLVQTISFPSTGSPALVFGSTVALPHDISLSADGALVVIPGYAALAASIESTTSAADNRVIATVKWDGTVAYPIINSALMSGQSPRGATSDGFGNFWATFTSGMRYVTPSAPTVSTTINGTGSRACAIFNGQLYASIAAGADSVSPNYPTAAATYVAYIAGATTADGFAIPTNPTVGSKAYVANYNDTTGMSVFTFDGSTWSLAYIIKFSGITGNNEHLAVDYSGANPVLYFTTTSGANNSLFKYVDNAGGGTFPATTVATATGGAIFRGVALAPTKPALPTFTTQPANTTNNYGDTATFGPVAADNANPNAWTWKFGATTLTNGNNGRSSTVSGATTTTLTIAGVTGADAGSYYAIASNNGGSTSSVPALLVLAGSCINPQLVSITNAAGTTAHFNAGVGSCAGPIQSFSWTLNGNPVFDGPTGTGATISGATTPNLTITNAQDGDAGLYALTLVDANSQQSVSAASLTVVDPPNISQDPGSLSKAVGTTANFTVVASGGSLSYRWFKSPSATALTNGPTGTGATISGATSATLSIANVQLGDAGTYSVTVTNLAGSQGSAPATLIVGQGPTITNAPVNDAVPAGSDANFTVGASGSATLTYVWKFNGTTLVDDGVHIGGATTASLTISNISEADKGTYAVTVTNNFGSASSSAQLNFIPAPLACQLASVPNQIVYEPFNYDQQDSIQSTSNPWTAVNVQAITNQATGVGLVWVNTGAVGQIWTLPQNMRIEPGYDNATLTPNGDSYPWPGLAGNDPQEVGCNSANAGGGLSLGAGGSISNGTVYFSMICHVDQGSAITAVGNDYFCGFGSGSPGAPTFNASIYIHTPGDDTYVPGVFKVGGGVGAISPGNNGAFSSQAFHRGQIIFAVCRLTIRPGITNDTCDLWLNPSPFMFGAAETNLPPADVANVGAGAADSGNVDFFWIKNTQSPSSRRFTDLRIGTTWASVTPPAPPTLSVASVTLPPSVTTATFPSHNVGNPVDCGPYAGAYQWQFTQLGHTNVTTLSDDGTHIIGSTTATLVVSNVLAADLGTYTVVGTSIDPLNNYSDPLASPPFTGDRVFNPTGTNWIGTASATLGLVPPPLAVTYSAPNAIITWPTNWTGYTLEQTTALVPSAWTTNSSPPYPIVGTNYSKSVNAASGTKFFRLIH